MNTRNKITDSYRDALTQKVSKKVKTSPASLEKKTFGRLKPSKLVEVRLPCLQL